MKIYYKTATPLLRFASYAIDYLIFAVIILLLYILFYSLQLITLLGQFFDFERFRAILSFFFIVLFFILRWCYYIFFEIMFNGKTPGKMIFRLRTIHYQGKFLDLKSIVLRNFVRGLDDMTLLMPVPLPIPAFICIIINKNYRRLGDLLANTVVIKEDKLLRKTPDFSIRTGNLNLEYEQTKILVKKLTENDLYILRKFLNSLHTFPVEKRKKLSVQMADTIKNKLGDVENYTNPEEYLKSIYLRHNDEY